MLTEVALEMIAVIAAGLFAGAALYVSAVEHPARMSIPMTEALHVFRPSYRRGAVMQVFLAIAGGLAGLAVGAVNGEQAWIFAAILLLLPVPYTLIFLMKINATLLDTTAQLSDADIDRLMRRWAVRHTVRTVLGLIAFVWMMCALFLRFFSEPL